MGVSVFPDQVVCSPGIVKILEVIDETGESGPDVLFHQRFAYGFGLAGTGSSIDKEIGEPVIISDNCPVRGVKGEQGFSALSAFSGDDPDAAKSILESFVTETRLNVDRLRQALETEDTDGIAAMGHKMLPLFTLLGANELVTLLKELEASRGVPFDEAVKEKSLAALSLIEDILEQAFLFISSA